MRHVLEKSVMRLCNWVATWIGQILMQRFDRVILQKGHLTLAQRPEFVSTSWSLNSVTISVVDVRDRTATQFSEINGKIYFCSQQGAREQESWVFEPRG